MEDLQKRAERAEQEAQNEPDVVVAASLRRQADALRASSLMSVRLAAVRRRREVLTQEVIAQIQAMRVSITHYQQNRQSGDEEFLALAHSIQQVAAEAAANAAAQDEVRAVIAPYEKLPVMQALKQ